MASANLASPSGRICSQYTTQCSLRRSVPAASVAPVYCCSSLSSAHSTSSFSPSVRDHAPCQSFSLQSSLPAKHQIIRRYPHGYEDIVCSASASTAGEVAPGLRYDHVLIALMDDNPYLSDGSKQVLATTAGLASLNKSKLTVLMVDAKASNGEGKSWIEAASWHLNEHGYDAGKAAFQEVSLESEETHNSSVVVGDAVDQVEADLVVLSAEAVHTKKVDCNLLAEFCTAPVLLLP